MMRCDHDDLAGAVLGADEHFLGGAAVSRPARWPIP